MRYMIVKLVNIKINYSNAILADASNKCMITDKVISILVYRGLVLLCQIDESRAHKLMNVISFTHSSCLNQTNTECPKNV